MNTVRKMVSLLMIVAFCIGVMPGAAMADSTSSTYSDAGIVSISAGASMSAAVLSDGTLWTWGCGERQLSVYGGSRKDIRSQSLGLAAGAFVPSTPMMVISNSAKSVKCSMYCGDTKFLGWADVGLYGPMTAVLRNDDTLWMWGSNGNGALGNGSTDYSWRPVKVLDNVVSYDASGHHSAAVTSDGALYTWGSNNYGQLGDGTTESSLSPKKIEGMENVVAVSLGEYHSAALKADGTLWIWGSNTYGQLGDGTTDNSLVPKQILTNVKDVSLGDYYSMALKTDGTVWVWGNNYDGRLGLGGSHQTPSLNENIEDICSIEAGTDFSAAIDTDGNLWMWGSNRNGKLGNGSSANTLYTPEIVMEDVEQVALGQAHALALKKDGSLWAWGSNYEGELGDFTTTSKSYPVQIYLGQIQATFGANDSSEAQAKTLLVPWSDAYLYADSSIYNKNLAIDGIVLSEAAYNSPGTVFAQFGFSYADSEYNGKYPSYYVGYRATYDFDNPHVEIMMAIRGTKGNDDILSDVRSIFDNFDSSADYCYSGLLKAEEKIVSFLNGVNISPTKSNTRYFLTGHSLGAACAGKVGIMLVKKGHAKAQNIYSYTYATPTYTTDPTERSKVPGQFNIINEKDTMVPNMPSVMFNGIIFIPAFRGGTDKYYGKNNGTFKNVLWQLYGYVPDEVGDGRPWIQHSAHMTPVYLAYLLADLQQSEINRLFSRARLVSAHCPVDVEVYDADGKLCAYTRGGEVEYCGNCAVLITVIGDEKYIAVPDGEYTIRYIGTDTGTMRIEDQILDSDTGEVTDERVFDGLAVETGKVFGGIADAALDVIDTEIFVLDAEGDKIKSVNEEGEETLLAKYTLTDDMIEFEKGQRFLYTGEPIMPEVTVAGLEKGVDYRLIYNDNTNTGHATVTVKGINEYAGRFTYGFDITAEGNCTDSISWSLDGNGTLMISGTGSMGEPEWDDNRWWYANRESVKNVIIESGITDIAEKTFYNHSAMSVIRLPESVTAIGSGTFTGCTGLKDVYFGGLQTDWDGVTIGTDNGALTDASLHCAIPEHDHVWGEWDITQAASCTEKGKRTRTCTICEEADVEEIPVTGHTPSNPVRENVVPATCEGNGSYDEVVYCSVCRAELSRETKTEEKLGHNWGEWIITKEPNKNEAGEKQRTCSRCDAAEKQVIPKINTGDLNGDDLRDYSDLEILIQCLHGTQAQDIMLSAADINGDTYVDYNDMALLANTIEVGMTTELAARFLNSGFQYEANLVLQCAVGLIDAFPAEPSIPVLDTAPENVTDASVLDLDAAAEEAEYTGNDQMTSEPDADYEADEGLTEVNTEQSDDVIDLVLEPELNNESEPVLLPEPVQIPAPEETKQNENASESESNDQ